MNLSAFTIKQAKMRAIANKRLSSPALGALVVLLIIAVAWQFGSQSRLIASPVEAISALAHEFAEGSLAVDFLWTVKATLIGFGIAVLLGGGIGFVIGYFRPVGRIFGDFVFGFGAVPKLVLFPIFLVIFHIGLGSEVSFITASAMYPILVNTMIGVREVPSISLKVGKAFRVSPWQLIVKIVIPSLAPGLVAGLRIGFGLALVHALLAEMIIPTVGLGARLWRTFRDFEIELMYGIIILSFVLTITGNVLFWYIEKQTRGRLA